MSQENPTVVKQKTHNRQLAIKGGYGDMEEVGVRRVRRTEVHSEDPSTDDLNTTIKIWED